MMLAIAARFCAAIRDAQHARADFPALTFQPFDAATVNYMLGLLPPLAEYREMSHPDAPRCTRYAIPLKQGAPVAGFWHRLADALKGEAVRRDICTMLGIDPATPMFPAIALLRDLPGYRIGIHPDTARKIATVQVYLSADDRVPHIGVRFYRQDRVAKDPTRFTETAAVPYLPGSGYFFRRTDASWHGVNATTEADGERNSLMLVYFDSPKIGFN